MFKRFMVAVSLLMTLGLLMSVVAFADEMQTQDPAMVKMMQLGAPNEHHKVLDVFVGKWNYTVSWKMAPNAPSQVSRGTSENKWVLGGRFIDIESVGADAAHPFEGKGLIGYDNIRQEYTSTWADNMSTGRMDASSQYNPSNQTFQETGTVSCPMTGEKHRKYHAITTVTDQDHYKYEMYMRDANGNEFKSMEIDYERAQ